MGKYDDNTKKKIEILFKKLFSWTMLSNSKKLSWKWVSPPSPPPAQLLSTTIYIYFMENWGALKINIYLKNLIIIYDNRLFEILF
jgi:hypothetical protein